jgi:hypothetical protein
MTQGVVQDHVVAPQSIIDQFCAMLAQRNAGVQGCFLHYGYEYDVRFVFCVKITFIYFNSFQSQMPTFRHQLQYLHSLSKIESGT